MTVYRVGPQCPFSSINSALVIASTGDTILIEKGIYNEVLYMNNKIVNLIGRTDHPLDGTVEVRGFASAAVKSTLNIKWENSSSITMLVEGISFKSTDDDQYGVVFFGGDGGSYNTSGLNVIFNKCIFNITNFTSSNYLFYYDKYYSYSYNVLSSLSIINCDVYTAGGRFVYGRFRDCSGRFMENCRLNTTPKGYSSTDGDYSDIFSLGSFDYISTNSEFVGYGPKYGNFLNTAYPKFYSFSGVIKENSEPVSRNLRFFRKDNDGFLGSTDSDYSSGIYNMETSYGGEHYIVCLDHSDAPYYNDLIKSKCFPSEYQTNQIFTDDLELINPGLEMGDLIGWVKESGSNIKKTDYRHSGSYSFGQGKVYQRIDLLAHGATVSGIDNEQFYFHTHAWKYYYYSDYYDINKIGTRLLDENDVEIGSIIYNNSMTPTTTTWIEDTHTRPIISGTRYVDIFLYVYNTTGYTTYYNRIDDVSCYLSYSEDNPYCFGRKKIKYYDLINPNFESGTTFGWTNEFNTLNVSTSYGYDNSFGASYSSGAAGIASQRVDLVSSGLEMDLVDAESLDFFISAYIFYSVINGSANLGMRFLDANQNILGSVNYSTTYIFTSSLSNKHYIFNKTVVSGTRYIDILLKNNTYARFDDVLLWSKEI